MEILTHRRTRAKPCPEWPSQPKASSSMSPSSTPRSRAARAPHRSAPVARRVHGSRQAPPLWYTAFEVTRSRSNGGRLAGGFCQRGRPRSVASTKIRASAALEGPPLPPQRASIRSSEHVGRAATGDSGHRVDHPRCQRARPPSRLHQRGGGGRPLRSPRATRRGRDAPVISAGVFGMVRTTRAWPPSQREIELLACRRRCSRSVRPPDTARPGANLAARGLTASTRLGLRQRRATGVIVPTPVRRVSRASALGSTTWQSTAGKARRSLVTMASPCCHHQ